MVYEAERAMGVVVAAGELLAGRPGGIVLLWFLVRRQFPCDNWRVSVSPYSVAYGKYFL